MLRTKKYFGITFGPIDRVLSYAKSTRSIWASSYFFSDLAKRIVKPLSDAGCKFLKPSVNKKCLVQVLLVDFLISMYLKELTG